MNEREEKEGQVQSVRTLDNARQIVVQLKVAKTRESSRTYNFDAVFGPQATQKEVFVNSISPIVVEVLNGYNCTIFAYGTTGTGKTFTMEGPRGNLDYSGNISINQKIKMQLEAGIISRSVHQIFEELEKNDLEYSVRVSHLELYNEDLFDLLNPLNKNLRLMEDPKNGVQITNLEELPVSNPKEIFDILEKSWEERRTAETNLNKNSSRSHCIFSITILMKETTVNGEDLIKVGKLNLVDLAGSENINRSGADLHYARKQEASKINKSLLTLGRVITALTEGAPHVPYRESKLTRLLRDSLGGKTKTCIIATISPGSGSLEETMSTLEYAYRAKNIKNRPEVNQKMAKREVIKEYVNEINALRTQIECMRLKTGVYLPLDQYNRLEDEVKQNNEKILCLEDMMERKSKEVAELQAEFEQQEQVLMQSEKQLSETKHELSVVNQELQTTKSELFEQRQLAAECAKTNEKLSSQIEALTSALKGLEESICLLECKNSKLECTRDTNTRFAMELRRACGEKLKVETEKQIEFFNRLLQEMNSLGVSKVTEECLVVLNRFGDQMYEMIDEVSKELLVSESASECASVELADGLLKIKNATSTSFDEQLGRMNEQMQVVKDHLKAVREQCSAMLKDSHEWCDHMEEQVVRVSREKSKQCAVEMQNYSHQIAQACEDHVKSNNEFIKKSERDMSQFVSCQKAKWKSQMNQFISSFIAFLDDSDASLEEYLSEQALEMNSASKASETYKFSNSQLIERQSALVSQWLSNDELYCAVTSEQLIAHKQSVQEQTEKLNLQNDALLTCHSEYVDAQHERIATKHANIREQFTQSDELVASKYLKVLSEHDGIRNVIAKGRQRAMETLSTSETNIKASERDCAGKIENAASELIECERSTVTWSNEIASLIGEIKYEACSHTHLTPQKRHLNKPAGACQQVAAVEESRQRQDVCIGDEQTLLRTRSLSPHEKPQFNKYDGANENDERCLENLPILSATSKTTMRKQQRGVRNTSKTAKKPSPNNAVSGKLTRSTASQHYSSACNSGKCLQEITNNTFPS